MSDGVDRPARWVHATAIVVGEAGVLIRGASGSGKSSLALLLIAEARRRGRFACLVGDDRIALRGSNGVVVARPHGLIAGLVECRTQGLVRLSFEPACVVRLAVDLCGGDCVPARLPDPDQRLDIDGLQLPLLRLPTPLNALSCDFVLQKLGLL